MSDNIILVAKSIGYALQMVAVLILLASNALFYRRAKKHG